LRRKYLFYTLALLSGFFTSLMIIVDIWILSKIIIDLWLFAISVLWAGVYIHFILLIVLSLKVNKKEPLGSFLDPLFTGIFVPRGKIFYYLLLSGFGNAVSSLGYFVLISIVPDPSAIAPFTSLVIVYLMIGDMIIEREKPSLIEVQNLLIILLGVMLVSFSKGMIDPLSLLLVLGPINIGSFLYNYGQRRAKLIGRSLGMSDSINFRFWSLLFTALIFPVLILPLTRLEKILRGLYYSIVFFVPLAIDMLITFFAMVFYIRALGMGKMSIVNALSSTSVIFSLPLTAFLSVRFPEVYELPSFEGALLYLRIIGITLVFLGIIAIALSEITAYILIKARPGYISKLLLEIQKIHGVEWVSIIIGKYDLIVRVKTRVYSKVYDNIIRRIIQLEGIEDFHWISVLKEWERI